ncbi:MAG: MgtC/SapB family protein [Actinomycetia bacterium]|nr:MgtC/SapB family protein [Actinomycetes bacterium]
MPGDWELLARVIVGFALGFVVGFEREVRGSPAGDRTFALIGGAATAVSAVVAHSSPQALAGVITGIGFIGAGVVVHAENALVRGITTAAAIFATASMGVVVGTGHLALGTATTALLLLALEMRYLPGLRLLDGRRYNAGFIQDTDPPESLGGQ